MRIVDQVTTQKPGGWCNDGIGYDEPDFADYTI